MSLTRQCNFKPTYDRCPTLAWELAKRIIDPIVKLDCTVLVRGKKGSGKSVGTIGLAYAVSVELSQYYKNKPPSYFFNVKDHVKTVDPNGTMDMFTADIIRRRNSILVADDVSISADARDAMTTSVKQLGKIMTVSRIYQNLVIMNSVYSAHVDKRVRGFADIIIDMIGIHKPTKQGIAKVYSFEVNQHSGKEYIKFFQWKGKRIKYYLFPMPPDDLVREYQQMRYEKTGEFLKDIQEKREAAEKPKVLKREQKLIEQFDKHYDKVVKLCIEGKSNRQILRECPGLTDSSLNKMRAQSGYTNV
jgi:hypothetical protein